MDRFITFGTKNINSSIFRDIVPFNTKPYGGLWLTKYTEINANEWLMFLEEHPSVFFQKFNGEASIIELNDNANILYINTVEDFNEAYNKYPSNNKDKKILDYEQIAKDYDLPFDNPKNVDLIKTIISSVPGKDFYVLDFFSGSATTADAVIRLNNEDGGNRKFILVQIPDKIENNVYDNICDVGEERIKQALEKNKTNLKNNYGFRVYKIDSSNMKDVYYKPNRANESIRISIKY